MACIANGSFGRTSLARVSIVGSLVSGPMAVTEYMAIKVLNYEQGPVLLSIQLEGKLGIYHASVVESRACANVQRIWNRVHDHIC